MSFEEDLNIARKMLEVFRNAATADHPEYLQLAEYWQNRIRMLEQHLPEVLRDGAGPLTTENGQLMLNAPTPDPVIRSDPGFIGRNSRGGTNWGVDPPHMPGGADPAMAYDMDFTLQPGHYLRYGGGNGRYLISVTDDFTMGADDPRLAETFKKMGLPYEYDPADWNLVTVREPVQHSKLSIIGDQPSFGLDANGNPYVQGGEIQFELPSSINDLNDKMTMTRLPPHGVETDIVVEVEEEEEEEEEEENGELPVETEITVKKTTTIEETTEIEENGALPVATEEETTTVTSETTTTVTQTGTENDNGTSNDDGMDR